MSTKKRFSIAPDLASGIRSTIQSAKTNQGNHLHYDMMPWDLLEPDPNNPRKLDLTREDIIHGLADTSHPKKTKEWEALKELSESIKRIGIKQAIEVYKNGNQYRIITGERRYWAALLAEQKSVPVRISQKPDEFNLRYTQWVENINRQDLSLWEKYNNLVSMASAYEKTNEGPFTEQALQSLLGISNIQTYRYYHLLKADDSVIQLLKSGKLHNLKVVQELVSMKDKGAKAQIISWILTSKEEVTSLSHYRAVAGKKIPVRQSIYSVSLGKIHSAAVARQLFEMVLANPRFKKYDLYFNNINWSSAATVAKQFKKLIKLLEKECNVTEIA